MAGLPNTSRQPAVTPASGPVRAGRGLAGYASGCASVAASRTAAGPAGSGRATGRARTQIRMISAATPNVTASATSEVRTPRNATVTPPATNPRTCANWFVVSVTAVPSGYRSPSRISGYTAARAAVNGAATSVTANSSTTSTATGSPGSAITATSAPLPSAVTIMTWRRGSRSARPASVTPPTNVGTTLAANVTAASSAERVRS